MAVVPLGAYSLRNLLHAYSFNLRHLTGIRPNFISKAYAIAASAQGTGFLPPQRIGELRTHPTRHSTPPPPPTRSPPLPRPHPPHHLTSRALACQTVWTRPRTPSSPRPPPRIGGLRDSSAAALLPAHLTVFLKKRYPFPPCYVRPPRPANHGAITALPATLFKRAVTSTRRSVKESLKGGGWGRRAPVNGRQLKESNGANSKHKANKYHALLRDLPTTTTEQRAGAS